MRPKVRLVSKFVPGQREQWLIAFVQPAASDEAIATLVDLGSPVTAFVRDMCLLDENAEITTDQLWKTYKEWSHINGQHPGTKAKLGRDLHAAFPQIQKRRPRSGAARVAVYTGIAPLPSDQTLFRSGTHEQALHTTDH